MKTLLLLSRVQLRALLLTLRVGGSRKKAASGLGALALASGVCLYISGFYSFALGRELAKVGALDLLLVLLPAMAVVMGLVFTAAAAQAVVFSGRDGDLLLSLPVPAMAVLLSKVTALYAENLVFSVFLVLPAGAARLWFGGGGGAAFLARLLLGTAFLALVPTVLSLGAGFLLGFLSGRLGNRRWVNLPLLALVLGAVMFLAVRINGAAAALAAGELGMEMEVPVWAWPFRLFQAGVCGSWGALGLFGALSLAALLLAAALLARRYRQVLTGLASHRKGPAYRVGALRASGPRRALLRKEAARFFGTPIYLMNAGLGLILLPVAGVASAVLRGQLRTLLAGFPPAVLPVLAGAAVLFSLSTAAVTASSISLEGQNLYLLRSAPLPAGDILEAKAAFQVLVCAPCLLIGCGGLAWALGLSPVQGGAVLLAGLAFSGFMALFGLAVNLHLPKLDALSDMAVVKQSAAALLGTFGGMAAAAVCSLGVWGLTALLRPETAWAFAALVLLALCAALDRWLVTRGAERFEQL